MSKIDEIYLLLLHRGMAQLQSAIHSNNKEWSIAEIEMLHNIPSLIGEENKLRHLYFFDKERSSYIERVQLIGGEPLEYMIACYLPLWDDMKEQLDQWK